MAKAGEFRDEETGNHVVRVGCYCRTVAERMGMPGNFIESIFLASPLHDIGKIGISDSILLKQGKLTIDEHRIMEKHCVFGAEILSEQPRGIDGNTLRSIDQNPVIEMAIRIALYHHERLDGTGYPHQLTNENIPIEARIVALADVYDALCSKRPYKEAFPEHLALEIIRKGVGSQFDPAVHDVFLNSLDEIHVIQTKLSN